MDPVTHTLVGASLASTSLARKTALAAPALIVGANLPDLDVFSYFLGGDTAIGFRRGWTHGVLALVVLPVLLMAALWLWHRVVASRRRSEPIEPGWLLAICYLAVLTHPCLDWLNTYGLRWLMPFRDTWFYGDSTFIVDPWLWLILGCGWLSIRRPTWLGALAWLLPAAFLLVVLRRSGPEYLPLLGGVIGVAIVAYLLPPPVDLRRRERIATLGLLTAILFIGLQMSIHDATVRRVRADLERLDLPVNATLMVGPTPANPLVWDVVVETAASYRFGRFSWLAGRSLTLADIELPALRSSEIWPEVERSGQLEGYLSWIRFPWYEIEHRGDERLVHIMDARYRRTRASGFGGGTVRLSSVDSLDP
ncbi:MAG: metal-dependent hydrolase [Acidobacteriota bacterium]